MTKVHILFLKAILFVYDITNNESFAVLEEWMKAVHHVFREECIMPHIALISNKGELYSLYAFKFLPLESLFVSLSLIRNGLYSETS